jgi:predicted acylesterase/phospholipase RssA
MVSNHLVLSGSGARFVSFLGAIRCLHDTLDPAFIKNTKSIVASSGGAIVAVMIALGYSLAAMENLSLSIDYSHMRNFKIASFLDRCGLDDGAKFVRLFRSMIAGKLHTGDATLSDLYLHSGCMVVITGTDLGTMRPVAFDHISYPTLPIWLALRVTMSMPLLFTPVRHDGTCFVDGAMLSPFPMSMLFDRCDVSDGDTVVGIRLNYQASDADTSDLPGYLMALTRTMLAHVKSLDERVLPERPGVHVIDLYTEPAQSLFDLEKSVQQREVLMRSAHDETLEYFSVRQTVHRLVSNIMHRVRKNVSHSQI